MTKTALHLTDEDIARYRAAARRQKAQAEQDRRQRKQRAHIVARRAAAVLKERFGAGPVMLFGSLARDDFFHQRSDIDLAVAGLQHREFWRAWSALDEIAEGFEIDLVGLETVPPRLRRRIEMEGVEL